MLIQILYARWGLPEAHKSGLAGLEEGMSPNVRKDMDWLEAELKFSSSGGKYLVGDHITAADIMMHFSIQFIYARRLGIQGGSWPLVEKWLKGLEQTESYKRAVEKTGYSL